MIDPGFDSQSIDKSGQRRPRRRVYLGVVLTLIGLGLTAFAILWFGTPPRIPRSVIHLVRAGNGPLAPVNPEGETGGVHFEAQACKIQSSNSFASSSTSAESGAARFACSRIAIFNRSDHLLMARVGGRLLELLKPVGYLQQVDYYPAGRNAEDGQAAPDLVVVLDLERLTEHPGLVASTLEANIAVQASNQAPDCHKSMVEPLAPPLVEFDWSGHLEHRSTTTGVSSSAARFQLAADDVAKQIATTLTKEFGERRKKYGPLPELPAEFYLGFCKPTVSAVKTGKTEAV